MDNSPAILNGVLTAIYSLVTMIFLPVLFFLAKRFIKSLDELMKNVRDHTEQIKLFNQRFDLEMAASKKYVDKHEDEIDGILTVIGDHTHQIGSLADMCAQHGAQIDKLVHKGRRNLKKPAP